MQGSARACGIIHATRRGRRRRTGIDNSVAAIVSSEDQSVRPSRGDPRAAIGAVMRSPPRPRCVPVVRSQACSMHEAAASRSVHEPNGETCIDERRVVILAHDLSALPARVPVVAVSAMTPGGFIAKWRAVELNERAASQSSASS